MRSNGQSGAVPSPRGRACASTRKGLKDVVDGAASFDRMTALEAHCAECVRCAAALREARALRRMLDSLTEPTATRADDDAFVAGVLDRLDAAPGPRPARIGPARIGPVRIRPARIRPVLALAASAAAALFAILWLNRPAEVSDAGAEVASAAQGAETAAVETAAVEIGAVETGATETSAAETSAAESSAAESSTTETADAETRAAMPSADVSAVQLSAVEFDVRSADMAPLEFAATLEQCAQDLAFDPHGAPSAAAFAAYVEDVLGASPRAAARAWLAGSVEPPVPAVDALAARILGLGADFRDRRVLGRSRERTGRAGRWALAGQGSAGIRELWRAAQEDTVSRDVLVALVRERGPSAIDLAPADVAAELVAEVATGASVASAPRLFARYLETGDSAWRTAWRRTKDADKALLDALPSRVRRTGDRRLGLLARALVDVPVPGGLDVALEALVRGGDTGQAGAQALAGLGDVGGADALLGATRSGRISAATEDAAWRAMLQAHPALLLSAAADANEFDLSVDATLRQAAGVATLSNGALTFLIGVAGHGYAEERTQVRALLAIADLGATSPTDEHRSSVDRLTGGPPRTAAAAWLASLALGTPADATPPVVRDVVSETALVAVLHLRLERALARLDGPGSD